MKVNFKYEFNTRPLVIFHANCMDGFTAAWVMEQYFKSLRKHLTTALFPEYVPLNYGEPFDMLRAAHRPVFMVDFSFKRDRMIELINLAAAVQVLDHHKTAQAELEGLFALLKDDRSFIKFSEHQCGSMMAWQEYMSPIPVPWFLDYVQDRDLWEWKLEYSKELNAAMSSYPMTFDDWDRFCNASAGTKAVMLVEGETIQRINQKLILQHIERARVQTIADHEVLMVNATVLFSEIAGELAKDRPFGVCYFDRADGKRQWSLRSTPDGVDVSEIAKQFGGGGHRNAAGFESLLIDA